MPDKAQPPRWDASLVASVKAVAVSAVVLSIMATLAVDWQMGVSTAVGGLLATVNLIVFARLGEAFLAQKGRSAPWALLGTIKLLGLFACVYILLRRADVSAGGEPFGPSR
jgi:hypothetical protein